MIWELQLPGPRTVTITRGRYVPGRIYTAKAQKIPVPTLLHVCKESRDFALRFYRLSFKTEFLGRPVYFDYERDLLFFPSESDLCSFYGRSSLKERREDLHEMAETEASVRISWNQ
jgi:hypothetical protein